MRRELAIARWLAFALVLVATSRADAETRRYAVIVAYGGGSSSGLAPLEYADDDGAKYHELFSQIADDVRLFSVLDETTQRVHPASARIALIPRRKDVLAGLTDVFERAQRDVAAGHEVVFYFVLVGHGKIGDGGEGYVALLDGTFTRTDMFQQVLAKSPATTNHIIVDACNAYFLVHRRGGGDAAPPRKEAVQAFVSRESLARYPNTGVLLSTSSEKDTHEWSVYRAGVFSHQLRSAIAGGADVNGDGEIAYSEAAAFLAAANQHVTEAARVEVFVRPPLADVQRPLVDLKRAKFSHWLHVPEGKPIRLYLEDSRGARYVDLHLGGNAVTLGLVPSAHYFARTHDGARELRLDVNVTRIDLQRERMTRPAVSARGAVEESFRMHLYEEPFDADYYRGFTAARNDRAVAFDVQRWRPGPIDAKAVDEELRRLNRSALADPRLRRRLSTIGGELVRLLQANDHPAAFKLLRGLEASR